MKKFNSILLLSLLSFSSYAQFGTVDKTYATQGVSTVISGTPQGMYILKDSKVLICATYYDQSPETYLAKVDDKGNLDKNFGSGGSIKTDAGKSLYYNAIQTDEKLIAFVSENNSCVAYRFLVNGSIDASFGVNGKFSFPTTGDIRSVSVGKDGKIYFVGTTYNDVTKKNSAIVIKVNANGTLDNTFSKNGVASNEFPNGTIFTSILQSDGKIILAGNNLYKFFLIRLNTDGTPDTGFGTNGQVTTNIGSFFESIDKIKILPNNKIIVTGSSYNTTKSNDDVAVVQYLANGTLDNTFGTNGVVRLPIGGSDDTPNDIVVQSDGKILIVGDVKTAQSDIFLLRLNPNGSTDNTFGTNGIITTNVLNFDKGYQVAIQSDGKILVASETNGKVVLVRYVSGLNVATKDFALNAETLIYPNPIISKATFTINLEKEEKISLNLCDINGRVVKEYYTNQNKAQGDNNELLDFDGIASGLYFLRVSNNNKFVNIKIIKN